MADAACSIKSCRGGVNAFWVWFDVMFVVYARFARALVLGGSTSTLKRGMRSAEAFFLATVLEYTLNPLVCSSEYPKEGHE